MKRVCQSQQIICIFNFDGAFQEYTLKIKSNIKLKLLMASDMQKYGGENEHKKKTYSPNKNGEINFNLPPFSAIYFDVVI